MKGETKGKKYKISQIKSDRQRNKVLEEGLDKISFVYVMYCFVVGF